jgi:hypothetical protein
VELVVDIHIASAIKTLALFAKRLPFWIFAPAFRALTYPDAFTRTALRAFDVPLDWVTLVPIVRFRRLVTNCEGADLRFVFPGIIEHQKEVALSVAIEIQGKR